MTDREREPVIYLRLPPARGTKAPKSHVYRVAGVRLVSEVAVEALVPFAAQEPSSLSTPVRRGAEAAEAGNLLYRGEGWVGGSWRPVAAHTFGIDYRLEVAGVGVLRITAATITCLSLEVEPASAILAETLLGPALILSLALHGVFCFHAAALARDGGMVLLVGSSGSGKSTLAAGLDGTCGWRRLADDVLPVATEEEGTFAWPRFPQLKLPREQQIRGPEERRLPIAAVYLLEGTAAASCGEVAAVRVSPRDGALALVRHTIAARLFAPELLTRHLSFCTEAAGRIPVWQLTYPHRRDAIREVSRLLRSLPSGL